MTLHIPIINPVISMIHSLRVLYKSYTQILSDISAEHSLSVVGIDSVFFHASAMFEYDYILRCEFISTKLQIVLQIEAI